MNELTEKEFTTWQARFAMVGNTLTRSNPDDGAVTYFVSRWGMAKEIHTATDLQAFFLQLGGKL